MSKQNASRPRELRPQAASWRVGFATGKPLINTWLSPFLMQGLYPSFCCGPCKLCSCPPPRPTASSSNQEGSQGRQAGRDQALSVQSRFVHPGAVLRTK